MENDKTEKEISSEEVKNLLPGSILISLAILGGAWIYKSEPKTASEQDAGVSANAEHIKGAELEESVIPSEGFTLPVIWGDLGSRLASVGAIDAEKLKTLYSQRGEFTEKYYSMLLGKSDNKLKITRENSGYLLNLFWALG